MRNEFIMSTTNTIEGCPIKKYIDTICSNIVIGTNIFSDFAASFTDFFGGRSDSYRRKLEIIYGEASKALKQKALNLGANAIVGFRVDFDEISGKDKSMFMVSVSGTACIIEMNNKELSEEEIIRTSISQSDLQKEIDRRYIISQIKDAVPLTSEWVEFLLEYPQTEIIESLIKLRRQVAEVRGKIRALGNVNVGAIEEYKEVKERYDFMKAQVTDVEKSRAELNRMIAELCSEMQEMFTASFKEINRNFGAIFRELFGGGSARLYLSDENDVLNSGIEIQVSPPGKVIKNLSALSGGEQALVAISIYFAILAVNPSPFCILDEIEAALDDVNVTRYAQYLRRMTERTQFIVITHRRGTMEAADVLYGVTMQEDGVSKILRLDLENVSADLIS